MEFITYTALGLAALGAGALTTHALERRSGVIQKRVNSMTLSQRLRLRNERAERDQRESDISRRLTAAINDIAPISPEAEKAQRDALLRSGMKVSVTSFWAARFLSVAVCLAIAAVAVSTLPDGDIRSIPLLALGAAVGFALPQLYLLDRRKRWRDDIERELPNALDLMATTVSAGTTLDSAVRVVAENSEGALADAFRDIVAQSRFMDITEALKNFSDNANVQPLTIFAASLVQAKKQGLAVAEILMLQAETVRRYRRARLEEEVNKLPVKIIFPIVFFIFPALFGVVLVPAAMQMLGSLAGM